MKSILIIGLGRFGRHMAQKFYEQGNDVMAVDILEDRVNVVLPYVTNAQIGDATDEMFLDSLGIDNYDLCVVTIGDNFQNSLETTALLKDWVQIIFCRAPAATCMPNFCCATVQMKSFTPKKKLPNA